MKGFFESQCHWCIEGTVWGGGGCTANALELTPPCVEPPMHPDVIEGCTSIGPESILLSRRWPDIGAIHLRCQTCHQYSILTHWSLVCNNYNRIVNQIISGYECFGVFFWEPVPLGGGVFRGLEPMCTHWDVLGGRRGAVVAARLMHWRYCCPVSDHQYIHRSLKVVQ